MSESFGVIASFYDEIMRDVPYDMWLEYYRLLLARSDHRARNLLDVCCGTGNVAELLTKAGFRVTGFDLSERMIAKATQKAMDQGLDIRYHTLDATSFELGETFDAAYSFFDSLNYITDANAVAAAIHQVGKHVKKGGSFIFDLNTAYAFEEKMFDQRDRRKSSPVTYQWKGDYDPATLMISVHMKFWKDGQEFTETHVQRAHPREEITAALAEAGFSQIEVFNSYTLDPPNPRSDRVHYVAIKGV